MTKREQRGINVINSHLGKRRVYNTYKKSNPEMAEKYLDFISKNTDAQYIKWELDKQRFI